MKAKIVTLAALLLLTACGEYPTPVTESRTPYQTITVNTPGMQGVSCVVQSGRNTYSMTAPGPVTVKRSPYPMLVNCFKGEHMRGQQSAKPNYARIEAEKIAATMGDCISCNYPRTITVAMRLDQESMSDTWRAGP
ncbi:MAG: hypothetical protein ACAH80_16965 [Alphaproteobacteria bacterium]